MCRTLPTTIAGTRATAGAGRSCGKTRMAVTIGYHSLQARDMVIASGMARGAGITYERPEDLATPLQNA
ncbi:MAG: hypothetical protein ABJC09_02585 [Terriglobia bacterium]